MNKFLPYAKQSINDDDRNAVNETLQSDYLTRGPKTQAFEEAVAAYCGARYAVSFNSGSSALLAACHAAQLKPFDRLITTPNTFVATVASALHCGVDPLFVDIDRKTGNMDLNEVELNIHFESSRGRNIYMPVHFAGIPVDIERLNSMITDPEALIIEDAAHAIGSSYADGQKVGSCTSSQMTIFSFHPSKTMTTGEGGMVTTNDEEYARRLRLFRNNGLERDAQYLKGQPAPWYYEVKEISNNTHMTEIQAALGLSQLSRLDTFVEKRRHLWKRYQEKLKNIPHLMLFETEAVEQTAFHLMVVQIDYTAYGTTRTAVMDKLKEQEIGTQVHYIPLYRHPFLAEGRREINGYFPEMEAYYEQALSLPLFYDMTEEDVDRVVGTLKSVLRA